MPWPPDIFQNGYDATYQFGELTRSSQPRVRCVHLLIRLWPCTHTCTCPFIPERHITLEAGVSSIFPSMNVLDGLDIYQWRWGCVYLVEYQTACFTVVGGLQCFGSSSIKSTENPKMFEHDMHLLMGHVSNWLFVHRRSCWATVAWGLTRWHHSICTSQGVACTILKVCFVSCSDVLIQWKKFVILSDQRGHSSSTRSFRLCHPRKCVVPLHVGGY